MRRCSEDDYSVHRAGVWAAGVMAGRGVTGKTGITMDSELRVSFPWMT